MGMRAITKDDFEVKATKSGYSVSWKTHNKFIKPFWGSGAKGRANRFVLFLVGWYKGEGWKINSEGKFYKGI